jgi:transcriptional regulator with XRE-family HTH domain
LRELRNIRLRRGLSQADLSAITGVAEYTISEIEAGKRPNPRPSTLRKLARGLGIEVTDLYGEPESPKGLAPPSQQLTLNGALAEQQGGALIESVMRYARRRADYYEQQFAEAEAGGVFAGAQGTRALWTALMDEFSALGELLLRDLVWEWIQDQERARSYTSLEPELLSTLERMAQMMSHATERVKGFAESEAERKAIEQRQQWYEANIGRRSA